MKTWTDLSKSSLIGSFMQLPLHDLLKYCLAVTVIAVGKSAADGRSRHESSPTIQTVHRASFQAGHVTCNHCKCNYECDQDGNCPEPTACFNSGKLVHKSSLQSCQCAKHFEGECCQTKICVAGGILNDNTGICDCKFPDYQYGAHCEFADCHNGGVIFEGYCKSCDKLWTGEFCHLMLCLNEGVRVEYPNGTQRCNCSNSGRFHGANCEQVTCDHLGLPVPGLGICQCSFLFKGPFCESLNELVVFGLICLILIFLTTCMLIVRLITLYLRRQNDLKFNRKPRQAVDSDYDSSTSRENSRSQHQKRENHDVIRLERPEDEEVCAKDVTCTTSLLVKRAETDDTIVEFLQKDNGT